MIQLSPEPSEPVSECEDIAMAEAPVSVLPVLSVFAAKLSEFAERNPESLRYEWRSLVQDFLNYKMEK